MSRPCERSWWQAKWMLEAGTSQVTYIDSTSGTSYGIAINISISETVLVWTAQTVTNTRQDIRIRTTHLRHTRQLSQRVPSLATEAYQSRQSNDVWGIRARHPAWRPILTAEHQRRRGVYMRRGERHTMCSWRRSQWMWWRYDLGWTNRYRKDSHDSDWREVQCAENPVWDFASGRFTVFARVDLEWRTTFFAAVCGAVLVKSFKPPTSLQKLRLILPQIWRATLQICLQRSMTWMRRRCQACINAQGGHSRHWLCDLASESLCVTWLICTW